MKRFLAKRFLAECINSGQGQIRREVRDRSCGAQNESAELPLEGGAGGRAMGRCSILPAPNKKLQSALNLRRA